MLKTLALALLLALTGCGPRSERALAQQFAENKASIFQILQMRQQDAFFRTDEGCRICSFGRRRWSLASIADTRFDLVDEMVLAEISESIYCHDEESELCLENAGLLPNFWR